MQDEQIKTLIAGAERLLHQLDRNDVNPLLGERAANCLRDCVGVLEKQRVVQAAFNNAIGFAFGGGAGEHAALFLMLWREGAWSEMAEEFPEFIARYGVPELDTKKGFRTW